MIRNATKVAVVALLISWAAGQSVVAHEVSRQSVSEAGTQGPLTEVAYHLHGDAQPAAVIKVPRGSRVRLLLIGAGEREMHLHGYDVLVQGEAGAPAVFEFEAGSTGRFPITVHDVEDLLGSGEKALVYVEVRNR